MMDAGGWKLKLVSCICFFAERRRSNQLLIVVPYQNVFIHTHAHARHLSATLASGHVCLKSTVAMASWAYVGARR
jgi:hypothetical protein